MGSIRLLTFETFARHRNWFAYWQKVRPWNGTLWLDRSPCSEPFFDPLHWGMPQHCPTIGGLCRPNLKLVSGDTRVYVAPVDPSILLEDLQPFVCRYPIASGAARLYAVVAVLTLVKVYPTHGAAVADFLKREVHEYVPGIAAPFPPNLLPPGATTHAVPAAWTVAYAGGHPHLPPSNGFVSFYRQNIKEYQQRSARVGFAVCRADYLNVSRPAIITGAELLSLCPDNSSYPAGNVSGRRVSRADIEHLLQTVVDFSS